MEMVVVSFNPSVEPVIILPGSFRMCRYIILRSSRLILNKFWELFDSLEDCITYKRHVGCKDRRALQEHGLPQRLQQLPWHLSPQHRGKSLLLGRPACIPSQRVGSMPRDQPSIWCYSSGSCRKSGANIEVHCTSLSLTWPRLSIGMSVWSPCPLPQGWMPTQASEDDQVNPRQYVWYKTSIKSGVEQVCFLSAKRFGIFLSLLLRLEFGKCENGIFLHTLSVGNLFNCARLD